MKAKPIFEELLLLEFAVMISALLIGLFCRDHVENQTVGLIIHSIGIVFIGIFIITAVLSMIL
jgi:hypothetical protein